MRKWIGLAMIGWLLFSDLSLVERDDILDTFVMRWLGGVPHGLGDRIQSGPYSSADECREALQRRILTLEAISASWGTRPFQRDGDGGRIQYFPTGVIVGRTEMRCVEQ